MISTIKRWWFLHKLRTNFRKAQKTCEHERYATNKFGVRFCANCGKRLGVRFCGTCGKRQ